MIVSIVSFLSIHTYIPKQTLGSIFSIGIFWVLFLLLFIPLFSFLFCLVLLRDIMQQNVHTAGIISEHISFWIPLSHRVDGITLNELNTRFGHKVFFRRICVPFEDAFSFENPFDTLNRPQGAACGLLMRLGGRVLEIWGKFERTQHGRECGHGADEQP